MPPHPLSRTSSASSVASDDTALSFDDNTVVPDTPSTGNVSDGSSSTKRTRKRFNNIQLTALEHVFHQTSHPTREQREAVARETGLELRSVTIWFQNKRQSERKNVLFFGHTRDSEAMSVDPTPFPVIPPHTHAHPPPPATRSVPLSANASYQRSIRHSIHAHRPQLTVQQRPSLDLVASRSERPQVLHKTPTRSRTYSSPNPNNGIGSERALWENMPSSPLGPSSPERERRKDWELVDFGRKGRTKKTLEWACAAARVSGRMDDEEEEDMIAARMRSASLPRTQSLPRAHFHAPRQRVESIVEEAQPEMDLGGDTEDESEAHEAVTPSSSQSRMDVDAAAGVRWYTGPGRKTLIQDKGKEKRMDVVIRTGSHDEEMVNAALVLCGLGKR